MPTDAHQNQIDRKSHPVGIKHLVAHLLFKVGQHKRMQGATVHATQPYAEPWPIIACLVTKRDSVSGTRRSKNPAMNDQTMSFA